MNGIKGTHDTMVGTATDPIEY